MRLFKSWILGLGLVSLLVAAAVSAADDPKPGPKLLFPKDYRTWVYLSSGLDMTYKGESGFKCKGGPCPKMFENVFVRPEAYSSFLKNKIWPDDTVFVLERRCSLQNASIDTKGSTQSTLALVAASQKSKLNGWNYYFFAPDGDLNCKGPDPVFDGQSKEPFSNSSSEAMRQACWNCHKEHGLKDNTFIQFYPTLKPLVSTQGK